MNYLKIQIKFWSNCFLILSFQGCSLLMMADITEEEFVELKEAFALYEKEGFTDINKMWAL